MQIIFNKNFSAHRKPADVVAGNRITLAGYQINAYAVLGINGQVTIEASDNDFVSTVYSNTITADSMVSITPITAAKWRITADPGVTIGQLFIGQLINIKDPTFPFAFEKNIQADDRKTKGGIGYSKIHHKKRSGQFNWHGIQNSELTDWRTWYEDSDGFRKGFVIETPLLKEIVLVRAPGPFPLSLERAKNLTGSMVMEEML